jgi:NitT/TauT family transport system substrate-binding protein
MISSGWKIIAVYAGFAALLSSFADRTEAIDKIRIAVPDVGGQFLTFPVAQSRGFLRQEGLDAEIILIRGNAALAAISSGDTDYTAGIPQGVRGALLGLPLKVVACFESSSTLMLLAPSGIKSVADLKGKSIAVGAVGGGPTRIARAVLKKFNLNPDKDVNYISAGAAQARIALVSQGIAAAAMVPPPYDVEGRKLGLAVLARAYEIVSFPQSGLTVNGRRLKERPDEIARVIKAGIRANGFIRSNRNGTIEFLKTWQRADAAVAAATYDAVWRVYSADGAMPLDGLRLVVQDTRELLEQQRDVAVGDLFDPGPLRKAQAELGVAGK